MKIKDFQLTPVTVPMEAPLRWSLGVEVGTTRTIIEVRTDDGITGLGETYGGNATLRALEFMRPIVTGSDPFEIDKLLKRLQVFCISYETFGGRPPGRPLRGRDSCRGTAGRTGPAADRLP